MPKLADIPISRVAPSGRATTTGPSRYAGWDMQRAARGKEIARATVGRGIQQIGAGIGAIGEKLHRQLVGDQSLTAGVEYETGLQKFLVDVDNTKHVKDGIPQWDKILEQGNIRNKQLIEGISKDLVPEAKEAFLLYAQKRKLNFDKTLYGKIQGIRGNYINEIFPLSMMRFARSGDTDAANTFLNQLKKYYFPKSQWQELDKEFDKNVVLGAIGNRLPDAHIERLIRESDSLTQEEKNSLRLSAKAAIASRQRYQAIQLKVDREKTMSTLTVNYWDGKLKDPQIVTEFLRAGHIDRADAEHLRNAIMNPDPPETTYEALITGRYAIDGIALDTETRESALKKVIEYTQQLSPTDGKAFIKEIFGEHDTKNAFWNRQAQGYMEKQIMEVASLTGILYGSGEQLALSAQALMAYDKAKKTAAAKGKPLEGKELLELAHEIMLPFRAKVKPLLEGEELPESLVPIWRLKLRQATRKHGQEQLKKAKEAMKPINSMRKPESVEEFISIYKSIPDRDKRGRYYRKWYKEFE